MSPRMFWTRRARINIWVGVRKPIAMQDSAKPGIGFVVTECTAPPWVRNEALPHAPVAEQAPGPRRLARSGRGCVCRGRKVSLHTLLVTRRNFFDRTVG